MKKLLIVESPAKIKTISKFLGKDFKIMSTIGHIKDLPSRKIGVELNEKKGTIDIEYVVMENKAKVISDIVKAAQKCDEVFLAPDPDREGEIIAWHIGEEIAKVLDRSKIKRITFNEITKDAILAAVANPSNVNMGRVAAQQARRVLDRWVGYEVSPILWRKIARGLSAGRVQSVSMRLVCEREEAIRKFNPEEFWSVTGTFLHNKTEEFTAALSLINGKKFELKSKAETDKVLDQVNATSFSIDKIQDKKRIKNPFAPFMTSTLQQAAYNKLGFSVKKTMQIAQKLYEGLPLADKSTPVALITYMRTDSLRISDTALKAVREFIGDNFDKKYLPASGKQYSKKNAKAAATQDAHEAVRPIDVNLAPSEVTKYLEKDFARLYELIWKRFVACQMKPALYAQRTVTLIGDAFTFKIVGSTLIFDGFLKVYKDDEEDKTVKIPGNLAENDPVDLNKLDPKQHFTQAPPRYNEASLVKELEKEGIGRPSTYASILSTIQARAYAELDDKKRFFPTELGFAVTNLLVKNLPKIMDTKFTAHMEEDLDKISQGEVQRNDLLNEFYGNFKDDLQKFIDSDGDATRETDVQCTECGNHNLSIRFGKTGEFLGCMGYPDCKFTSNFARSEDGTIELKDKTEPILLDEKCPQCKKVNLREMVGRYGKFISCSGYPDCKYIKQEKADVKCSVCSKGDMTKRRWSGGEFWGCANYPKCRFAVFGDIVKTACPDCKQPYMGSKQLKSGVVVTCPIKTCKYKKKD
jgi:DNA topoisomerase-1